MKVEGDPALIEVSFCNIFAASIGLSCVHVACRPEAGMTMHPHYTAKKQQKIVHVHVTKGWVRSPRL